MRRGREVGERVDRWEKVAQFREGKGGKKGKEGGSGWMVHRSSILILGLFLRRGAPCLSGRDLERREKSPCFRS